ncbi:FeoA family protein [Parachitinimonas caeni]|uniref:FeoA family protein n=1 Tax=Parachitinimonas caeni TaxID=3031301 RepID=A0ABT7E019_9NEIS|nr:FeoA family protein [Parachitinimonas caeni]MDK2125662.1 FeoA family protein [Parachitinimonas caeni]
MSKSYSLLDLNSGERATVSGLALAASPLRRRLLAIGFLPGTHVEVLRRAPLGDPIEVAVRGTTFALRREEAAALHVIRFAS